MISIIIISANKELLHNVKQNIAATVGVPYEVIAFDNSGSNKGICQVYNEGISKAQFDVLCFMHEDIALKSFGWGEVVAGLFARHKKMGIIGIAGSTYKSIMPTGWGCVGAPGANRSNLIQSFKYMKHDSLRAYANPNDESWSSVIAVDGAWMCVRREVVEKYRFDEETFKGFHCYDLDFCLSAGREFDIVVTYEILVNHFSEGKVDRTWMEQTLLLFFKWNAELPRSIIQLSEKRLRTIEKRNFRYFVKQLRDFKMDKNIAYQVLHQPAVSKILGLKYYLKFHYTILATFLFGKKKKPEQDFILLVEK